MTKRSRRECLLGLMALSTTSLLAACAPAAPSVPTPNVTATPPAASTAVRSVGTAAALSPRVAVHYGTIGVAPEAAVYIAYERGYFRDEGLDVDFVQFTSGGADGVAGHR